jgi:tetratricopeptide (TPR) repeat protein
VSSNHSEEAIAVYDDDVARYKDASEPALCEQVAGALYNKGWALGQLNRSEAAIAVYDDLVARYKDAPNRRCARK